MLFQDNYKDCKNDIINQEELLKSYEILKKENEELSSK